jgi:cardiolipin synthase C
MTDRPLSHKSVTQFSLLLCLCGMLAGCALPSLATRTVSVALGETEARATRLGMTVTPKIEEHPGKSGFYALRNPHDAFRARMFLIREAERTLDVQYYIWHGDITGTLLLEALHRAADRGVRVRLLLDDGGTAGLDEELNALDSHPNIEVRLFNPCMIRGSKWLGYLIDFSRLNRRMHNKSFTADNQATVVGGRNVGDEYFGATNGVLFADLDVFCVGPVVNKMSSDFDRYWASQSSYPIGLILPPIDQDRLDQLAATALTVERNPAASAYVNAVRQSNFVRELLEGTLSLEWTDIRMVSDDPAKGLGKAEAEGLLTHQLREIVGVPTRDVALVSPYFVPTAAGVEAFSEMAKRGVKVRILTNSLDATDVTVVHAGYAKWRKELLKAGVILYEMKSILAETESNRSPARFGSSGSSLHAKTFAVDGERVFVGSFNFDPRSVNLNTELGFIIDSPGLARQIDTSFNNKFPARAYEVRISEEGQLYWLEQQGEKQIRHDSEPNTSFWKRGIVFVLSMLPIEWLL